MSGNNMASHVNEGLPGTLEILRSFFNLAPVMCVVLDKNGVVQVVNPFAVTCLGCGADEITGKDWFKDFMPETPDGCPRDVFNECILAGGSSRFEGRLITRNGQKIIECTCGVIRDEAVRPISFILAGRDVTGEQHHVALLKEREENLYRMIAREKKLNELRSGFISMALHEFRTPLSTILSSVFLLESYKGDLYETNKTIHTSRIKRTVNILTEILNDFLRLVKLEEGKVEMKLAEVNIPEQAEEALKAVYPLKKNCQKILYQHSGLRLNVYLDENLLRSILLNLLSNGIKYSHEDGEIVFETRLSEEQFEISVMDHGIGIASADSEHIFERFFRGVNAENIEGTGLGLHIVKGYVEVMNGTIDFVSDAENTVFFVKIPLQMTPDQTRLVLR